VSYDGVGVTGFAHRPEHREQQKASDTFPSATVRYADWAEEIPRAYFMTGKTYDPVRLNGYPASNRAAAKRELAFALPTLSLLTKLAPNPTDHDLFFVRHG
jgi:hypothetical protein